MLPRRGEPDRPGPTTDRGNPAADLLQIASSLIIDTTADCNFAAREDHLAPRAGRGRKARAARHPGEGQMAAGCSRCKVAGRPLTPPAPRKQGEGVPSLSGLRVGPPFGDRAVGAGDDFQEMAVVVLEIEAAAAIEMVDLAASVAVEVGVERDAGVFDAGQRAVELVLAQEKGVVSAAELGSIGVIAMIAPSSTPSFRNATPSQVRIFARS